MRQLCRTLCPATEDASHDPGIDRMHSYAGDPARPHRALDADDLAAVVGGDTTLT